MRPHARRFPPGTGRDFVFSLPAVARREAPIKGIYWMGLACRYAGVTVGFYHRVIVRVTAGRLE